jgi:hypothetical protein
VSLSLPGARIVDAGGFTPDGGTVALGTLFAGQHRTLWVTVEVPGDLRDRVDLGSLTASWRRPDGSVGSASVALAPIGVTADPRVAYAALDDRWAASVVDDEYNALRTRLSAAVKRGDRAGAQAEIDRYESANAAINQVAQNPRVADNLRGLQQLRTEVDDNFQGADQAAKQNLWSKGTRVDAYAKRRVGQVAP